MRSAGWVFAAGLIGGTAHAGAFPYAVHTQTLDNGLQVVVVPMPSPGVAALGTWMRVGSRDEVDPGRTGFAHFFEHLMFLGTPSLSADERERELLRMGADDNAWTWFDETVYHVLVPSAALERLIRMEGDRFQHLTLTPEQVRRESGAVLGEYRKGRSDPGQRVTEALQGGAFRVHTYGHDTIGYEPDILAMPDAHAYAATFFSTYYRPERAMVLAVGDVDPEAVFAAVREGYGGWTPGVAAPPPPAEPV
ncbi:MAG TPA: pitrilysin family protein, partial [Myxococcota bacterium]|nr:pitrilysin family protein [Myxococcota bacterium]